MYYIELRKSDTIILPLQLHSCEYLVKLIISNFKGSISEFHIAKGNKGFIT